jgi:hypothetical protein
MTTVFKRATSNVLKSVGASPYFRVRSVDIDSSIPLTSSTDATPGESLRSTQQIPLDWSKFENHTFFSSAEVNVNVAFDTIINSFPFDGNQREIKDFKDNLTGFEKYVYDIFPKNTGYLRFENSNKILVNDIRGGLITDLSKVKDGSPSLDPGAGSLSFQFKIFLPSETNQNMTIFQRLSGSDGYSLFVSSSASTTTASVCFYATSGSASIVLSSSIDKGSWKDVCAQFNRKPGVNRLFLYFDGQLSASSSISYEFSNFDTRGSQLVIGSGSTHSGTGFSFEPAQLLSGAMDDFKVFHKARTAQDISNLVSGAAYPSEEMKMFYKFNEPTGSFSQNSLVIDSSGNGLHSNIVSFSSTNRSKIDGFPTFFERVEDNPILFPDYTELVSINQTLLSSASYYDDINPNLITKLVPKNYFEEGQAEAGLETLEGGIVDSYPASGDLPGQAKLGSSQILSSLLYIWAKQFDETKIYLDHFPKLESYEYVSTGSVADNFLQYQARNLGFELPKLFTANSYKTLAFGDNIGTDPGIGTESLVKTQSEVWRRLVASFPDIIRSKGTSYAVKSLIRAFGINPDTSLRLREYGGASTSYIGGRRIRRAQKSRLAVTGSWNLTSDYLSGSRIEPGYPFPSGSLSPSGSDVSSDGLFTSGSWTWEGLFRYPPTRANNSTESLVRFYSTGSSGPSLLVNVLSQVSGTSDDGSANITLHGAYSTGAPNPFSLTLYGPTLYDGKDWQISFGRTKESETRSLWFLRAGSSVSGDIASSFEITASVTSSNFDVFSNIDSSYNSSGSYFIVGTEQNVSSNAQFLNTSDVLTGSFSGDLSSIRFYSKNTEREEWLERIRNQESQGVSNPLINYNFVTSESGSFERLRIDASFEQDTIDSDTLGSIEIFDFSQNGLHLSGSGFNPSEPVILKEDFIFSSLEPKFDERSADNKVRVRSWLDEENVERWGGEEGSVFEVLRSEETSDDMRFGIELSIVKALDEDIVRMFADYSSIDNAIGATSSLFEDSYESLESLSEIYFNRLTEKIDFRNIFLFSRWFEDNISSLIEQVLPVNTRFLGTNFVIESHMLERSRVRYHWGDIYLGEEDRLNSNWDSNTIENYQLEFTTSVRT